MFILHPTSSAPSVPLARLGRVSSSLLKKAEPKRARGRSPSIKPRSFDRSVQESPEILAQKELLSDCWAKGESSCCTRTSTTLRELDCGPQMNLHPGVERALDSVSSTSLSTSPRILRRQSFQWVLRVIIDWLQHRSRNLEGMSF